MQIFEQEQIFDYLANSKVIIWVMDANGYYQYVSNDLPKNRRQGRKEKFVFKYEQERRFGQKVQTLKLPIIHNKINYIFGISIPTSMYDLEDQPLRDLIRVIEKFDFNIVNMFIKDQLGNYRYLSKGCLYQIGKKEFSGSIGANDILKEFPETLRSTSIHDEQVIINRIPWAGEEEFVQPDGDKIKYFSVKLPLKLAEEEFVLGYSINIQSYKERIFELQGEIKEIRQSSEFKNESDISKKIAGINHDISSTVNDCIQVLEILKLTEISNEKVGYINSVSYTLASLKQTIEMLINEEFIRQEFVEEIGLQEISDLLLGMYNLSAHAKKIKLNVNLDDKLPKNFKFKAYKVKFYRILINLINNSVKYTVTGHVNVNISVLMHNLIIEFEDTGPGFPENVLQNIRQKNTNHIGVIKQNSGFGWHTIINYAELIGVKIIAHNLAQGSRVTLIMPLS